VVGHVKKKLLGDDRRRVSSEKKIIGLGRSAPSNRRKRNMKRKQILAVGGSTSRKKQRLGKGKPSSDTPQKKGGNRGDYLETTEKSHVTSMSPEVVQSQSVLEHSTEAGREVKKVLSERVIGFIHVERTHQKKGKPAHHGRRPEGLGKAVGEEKKRYLRSPDKFQRNRGPAGGGPGGGMVTQRGWR